MGSGTISKWGAKLLKMKRPISADQNQGYSTGHYACAMQGGV